MDKQKKLDSEKMERGGGRPSMPMDEKDKLERNKIRRDQQKARSKNENGLVMFVCGTLTL